jgi:hypothetical protein
LSAPIRQRLRSVQLRLERLYALEPGPNVVDFVSEGEPGQREHLVLRQHRNLMEITLRFPPRIMQGPLPSARPEPSDIWLQLIEGASHFVHLVQRARADLPTTLLELELQAEVDKFVLLALLDRQGAQGSRGRARAVHLHRVLFENVCYLYPPGTPRGERYRLANSLAARYVVRLLALRTAEGIPKALRRFFRSGQADKVWLATLA